MFCYRVNSVVDCVVIEEIVWWMFCYRGNSVVDVLL